MLAAFWTEERAKWAAFTKPVGQVTTGFFRRRSRGDITFDGQFPALAPYVIAVGKGYSVSEEFDQADYLKKTEITSSESALAMLFLGRVDLVAGVLEVDRYHLLQLEGRYPGIQAALEFMAPPGPDTLHASGGKSAKSGS